MQIINRGLLAEARRKHAGARRSLTDWELRTESARWPSVQSLLAEYPRASAISNQRVVFRLKGNDFRLIATINYAAGVVMVNWFGTHAEYDRVDALTVNQR